MRFGEFLRPAINAMSWVLRFLARLVSGEFTPGTLAHYEAHDRIVKDRNEELEKPPQERDIVRLVEISKRDLQLRAQTCRVSSWRAAGSHAGYGRLPQAG